MKYQIVGKNMNVSASLAAKITAKLSRLDKYFRDDEAITCRTLVTSHKDGMKVEVTIFNPQMVLRAEVKSPDVQTGIDQVMDKLRSQMRRFKTRYEKIRGKKLGFGKFLALENIEAGEAAGAEKKVVRTKSVYLVPMSLEEAVMRMDALGHDFFIFLDEDERRVSVCYSRAEGGYGVIQAENELRK